MGHEITGVIIEIGPIERVSDRYTKRCFVIEERENPKYPQTIQFELSQDNVGKIERYQVGDEISVEFNVRGRRWTSPRGEVKYFNTLSAWKLKMVREGRGSQPDPRDQRSSSTSTSTSRRDEPRPGDVDDIPF